MAAHGTCLIHLGRKGPHPAGLRDGGLAGYGHLAFLGAKLRLMSQVGPGKDPNCPKVCVITLRGGYEAVRLFWRNASSWDNGVMEMRSVFHLAA